MWRFILVLFTGVAVMGANVPISGLSLLSTPSTNDLTVVVDVSDLTQSASGTTKRMTWQAFLTWAITTPPFANLGLWNGSLVSTGAVGTLTAGTINKVPIVGSMEYPADPTAATDSAAIIQAAIDYAATATTGSKRVEFLPGRYLARTPLILRTGVTISGPAWGSSAAFADCSVTLETDTGNTPLFVTTANIYGVVVENMRLFSDSNGGHIFAPSNIVSRCIFRNLIPFFNGSNYSFIDATKSQEWTENLIQNIEGVCRDITVPFLNLSSSNNVRNVIDGFRITSGTLPMTNLIKIAKLGGGLGANFSIKNGTFEVSTGGGIVIESMHNGTIENCIWADAVVGTVTNHFITIGKEDAGSGSDSTKISLKNVYSIYGDGTYYDLYLRDNTSRISIESSTINHGLGNGRGVSIVSDSATVANKTNFPVVWTTEGQSGFTGATMALLPSGLSAGYQAYATDVLTPYGTGGRIEWDGSNWRTVTHRILATTNHQQFMFNALAARTSEQTPITEIGHGTEYSSPAAWSMVRPNALASGTITTPSSTSVTYTFAGYSTSTSASGHARAWGPYLTKISANEWMGSGATIFMSAACDGTETYWALTGMASVNTAVYPVTGAFFLYDMFNVNTHNQAFTNNWICVTASASSYTYADSGLPVSTSNATLDKLAVIVTTTAAQFYTNGVLANTITTTLPFGAGNAIPAKTQITKTAGTTARVLNEANPWYHYRHASRAY